MPSKKVDVLNLEGEIRSRGCGTYILSKGNQDDDDFYIDDYSLSFDKICVCPVANGVFQEQLIIHNHRQYRGH